MKFLQKQWVARILCFLMILAAFGIARNKQQTSYQPSSSSAVENWGEENHDAYTRYIMDKADLFSDSTVRKLSEYNAGLDYAYGSICGVATLSGLDEQDIESAAYDMAELLGLGSSDYLLLLEEQSQDWYFAYGDDASYYVDNHLEILVTGSMDTIFQDADDSILELFEDLQDWYADTVPVADSASGNASQGLIASGTVLFVALIVLLVVAALLSSALRAGRRFVGGWWPVFIGRSCPHRPYVHRTPPPGPRPNAGTRHRSSARTGSAGGFGGSSRGNFGRGGGFGGGSRGGRGGGFGGRR